MAAAGHHHRNAVFVGGGDHLVVTLRAARLDHSRGTRIVPAGLGADGPLVGAAAVAWYRSNRREGTPAN